MQLSSYKTKRILKKNCYRLIPKTLLFESIYKLNEQLTNARKGEKELKQLDKSFHSGLKFMRNI